MKWYAVHLAVLTLSTAGRCGQPRTGTWGRGCGSTDCSDSRCQAWRRESARVRSPQPGSR